MRAGDDLCDVALLDETADLFYDDEEPSPSIARRATWLHDYLKDALPDVSRCPDGEGRICAMLGMTEGSYEFVSGAAANVYLEEDSN